MATSAVVLLASPEEEEPLCADSELVTTGSFCDLRKVDDPDWFADGAQVEMFGLKAFPHLNGLTAEVVGFDDEYCRYRVRIADTGVVKVVAKKNLKLAEPAVAAETGQSPSCEVSERHSRPTVTAVSDAPILAVSNLGDRQMALHPLVLGPVPTIVTIVNCLDQVQRDTSMLRQRCLLRQHLGSLPGESLSDIFVRLNLSVDTFCEALEKYEATHDVDEELRGKGEAAMQAFEETCALYRQVRTWAEMAQEEFMITKCSIQRHGFIGTLRNELVESGKDVASAAKEVQVAAAPVVSAGAVLARQATTNLATRTSGVRETLGVSLTAGTTQVMENVTASVHHQVVGRAKRLWHFVATALFLCFILPLFCLRVYAPLNSIVANLGLLWACFWLMCPPAWAQQRKSRMGFLVLWPSLTVFVPILIHTWVLHPGIFSPVVSVVRTWIAAPFAALRQWVSSAPCAQNSAGMCPSSTETTFLCCRP